MTPLARREFRRILIIKPSSPGDIIHALPVLHGLRRRHPQAHIAWLVASAFAELLAADPALNELILFDRRRYGRLGRDAAATQGFAEFARGLRRRRFDLVVDLQGLFRSGFFAWLTAAPVRLGFASTREFAWMFYTHRLPYGSADRHAADRNYRVAGALGFDERPMDFSIVLSPADHRAAEAIIEKLGPAPSGFAVLVPGTRWETKCWRVDRFAALTRELWESRGLRSILVGGAADRSAAEQIAHDSDGCAMDACGRTTLRQLAAIIHRAALVVTADSTPMHLAAALHRPQVALFGPTNPRRTGPYGHADAVLRLALPCSPCYLRRLRDCPYDHACMEKLTVDAVLRAAHERVDRAASS